jgi:hypothetical protein
MVAVLLCRRSGRGSSSWSLVGREKIFPFFHLSFGFKLLLYLSGFLLLIYTSHDPYVTPYT